MQQISNTGPSRFLHPHGAAQSTKDPAPRRQEAAGPPPHMPDKGPPPAGGWLARLKEPKVWLQAGLVLLAIKKTLFSSKRGDADKTTAANVVEDVEPEPPDAIGEPAATTGCIISTSSPYNSSSSLLDHGASQAAAAAGRGSSSEPPAPGSSGLSQTPPTSPMQGPQKASSSSSSSSLASKAASSMHIGAIVNEGSVKPASSTSMSPSQQGPVMGNSMQLPDPDGGTPVSVGGSLGDMGSGVTSAALSPAHVTTAAQQFSGGLRSSSAGGSFWVGLLAPPGKAQEVSAVLPIAPDTPSAYARASDARTPPAAAQALRAADASSSLPASPEGSPMNVRGSPLPAGSSGSPSRPVVVSSGTTTSSTSSTSSHQSHGPIWDGAALSDTMPPPDQAVRVPTAGRASAASQGHTWSKRAVSPSSAADAAAAAQQHYIPTSSSSASGTSRPGLLAAAGEGQEVQPGQLSAMDRPLPCAPTREGGATPTAARASLLADAGSRSLPANLGGSQLSAYASPPAAGGTPPGARSPGVAKAPAPSASSSSRSDDNISTSRISSQGPSREELVLGDTRRLSDQVTGPEPDMGGPSAASSQRAPPKSPAAAGETAAAAAAAAQQHTTPLSSSIGSEGGGSLLAPPGKAQEVSAVLPSAPDTPSAYAPASGTRTPSAAAQALRAADPRSSLPVNLEGSPMNVCGSPLPAGSSGSPSRPVVVSGTTTSSTSSTSSHQSHGPIWDGAALSDTMPPPDQAVCVPTAGRASAASQGHTWSKRAVSPSAAADAAAAAAQQQLKTLSSFSAGDTGGASLLAAAGEVQEESATLPWPLGSALPSPPTHNADNAPAVPQAPLVAGACSRSPANLEGSDMRLWFTPTTAGSSGYGANQPATAISTSISSIADAGMATTAVQKEEHNSSSCGGSGNSSRSSSSSTITTSRGQPHPVGSNGGGILQLSQTSQPSAAQPAAASTTAALQGAPSADTRTDVAAASKGKPNNPKLRGQHLNRIAPPKGRGVDAEHRHAQARYLAALRDKHAFNGPLAPFLARSIPPLVSTGFLEGQVPSAMYLKSYASAVLQQHILLALVAEACEGLSDQDYEGQPSLKLDDSSTVERVAKRGWTTLQDAAAAAGPEAAAAAAEPGADGSQVERWPLTCRFDNPYTSYQHFLEDCHLLRDLPGLVLRFLCEHEYKRCYNPQGELCQDFGEGPFKNQNWPFLCLQHKVCTEADPGSGSSSNPTSGGGPGDSGSSGHMSNTWQPAGRRPGWELVVYVGQLRTRVWGWSMWASQNVSNVEKKLLLQQQTPAD